MSVLPIVSRELRVAARKYATYWNRTGVALVGLVVATFAILILQSAAPKQTGITLFICLSIVAFLHCLLMGFIMTADSLSEEKRDGTLGLLFLTDLKGYDVVLGKLAVSSLRGIFGVLAIFPILGICLLLGGVTGAEFARVMLVCVTMLFLSASIGMLASALTRDERKSLIFSFLWLLLLTAGLPGLGGWLQADSRGQLYPLALYAPSPGYAAIHAFAANYKAERFITAIVVQHAIAWGALVIAFIVVPRSWQDKTASTGMAKRERRFRDWVYGSGTARAEFRRRLLAINPYYWLAARHRFRQTTPWLWLCLAGLIWIFGLLTYGRDWRNAGAYVTTAYILHGLFRVFVALEASRHLGADRQSGALELLLCTPMTPRDVVRGQWLALFHQFAAPVAVLLVADAVFLAAGMPFQANDRISWIYTWLAGVSVFVLDLIALGWLAMWAGLTNRRSGQGGISALLTIGVLPWLLFLGFVALLALLDELKILKIHRLGRSPMLVWWLLNITVSVSFALYAYRRLHRDLRAIATQRYMGRGAVLGRALGLLYGRWKTR